jgi:5-methylcytosine-specific restriction endonuclease McrA
LWQRLRPTVLDEEPLCRFCAGKGLAVAATEVDHIVPIALRPDLRLVRSNLRPLCRSCHASLTASGVQRRDGRDRS